MRVDNYDSYVVLADDYDDLAAFASFLEFQILNKFKGQNVVINLSNFDALTLEQMLLFLEISNKHRFTKQSFLLVSDALDLDDIPHEMIVVPTLQEATDIIEMEQIERDMGF